MKNVLTLKTKLAKYSHDWKGHSAWLWDAVETTKKAQYSRKNGILKRRIHIPFLSSIIPTYKKELIAHRVTDVKTFPGMWLYDAFTKEYYQSEPDVVTYGDLKPITVSIEMNKADADKCAIVEEFLEETSIFYDFHKEFRSTELVRVFANKNKNGTIMTLGQFRQLYGQRKIFCFLSCNSYCCYGNPRYHFVLF